MGDNVILYCAMLNVVVVSVVSQCQTVKYVCRMLTMASKNVDRQFMLDFIEVYGVSFTPVFVGHKVQRLH